MSVVWPKTENDGVSNLELERTFRVAVHAADEVIDADARERYLALLVADIQKVTPHTRVVSDGVECTLRMTESVSAKDIRPSSVYELENDFVRFAEKLDAELDWGRGGQRRDKARFPDSHYRWGGARRSTDHQRETVTQVIRLPLSPDGARAASDTDRLTRFLKYALHDDHRGQVAEVLHACEVSLEQSGRLCIAGPEVQSSRLARAVLETPRGRTTRHVDLWPRSWTSFAGWGGLGLVLLMVAVAPIPVTLFSGLIAGTAVIAFTSAAGLWCRWSGGNPSKAVLGMAPALIVWGFAFAHACGDWVAWSGEPLRWIDPLLLSLSIAATVGYLDYQVSDALQARMLTLAEMLLVVSILGGSAVAAVRSVVDGLRERARDQ